MEGKSKVQNYERRIVELNQKIKNIKEENEYLFNKIEDFNSIISEKNEIINQLSADIKQKNNEINEGRCELEYVKKKNEEMESVIILLNKSIEENIKCSCNNITIETDDGEKQKEYYQFEIERYKLEIQELKSNIKYSEIQNNVFQKIRYDLDNQLNKN